MFFVEFSIFTLSSQSIGGYDGGGWLAEGSFYIGRFEIACWRRDSSCGSLSYTRV
jgi:hypothetical protein